MIVGCITISPIANSPNQWFQARVSHVVYIELVLAGEMGMGEMGINRSLGTIAKKSWHSLFWSVFYGAFCSVKNSIIGVFGAGLISLDAVFNR